MTDFTTDPVSNNFKPITPLVLANTFIDRYGRESGIQHMKLQKLDYFAHGWWLAYNQIPLLTEKPQVWRYGPVFKSLYSFFAPFGKTPICEPQKDNPFMDAEIATDPKVLEIVDWIWTRYSRYSAIQLSDMTHAEGTPWLQIAKEQNFKVKYNYEIDDLKIKTYFEKLKHEFAS